MGKLVIDLSNPDNYILDTNNEEIDLLSNALKVPLPVEFDTETLEGFGSTRVVIGEVKILNAIINLKGNIFTDIVEDDDLFMEENPFLQSYFKTVRVTINEEAVGILPEDAKIQFSMRSDLFKDENVMEMTGELDTTMNRPAEFICSQFIPAEDEDESDDMEYFILPGNSVKDVVYPESINAKGGERWFFTYDEESIPVDKASKTKKRPKIFNFRIFKLNSLRKKAENIFEGLKEDPHYHNWKEDDLIDETIRKLKKDEEVASEIKDSYSINIYRPNTNNKVPFVKVDENENKIDPALKTLILIPGTFKKSIVWKNRGSKKKRWQGSFKYLMTKTDKYDSWFEFVLGESDFEQIITLEHNSVFDNMQENMRFFIDHLHMSNIRFDKPTSVISASRGGFLAKMLARVGSGNDDQIFPKEINLNIDRIITVANGFSGYLEPSNKEEVKKKIELLFNLINMISFGGLTPFAGLLSFTPNFILRLPGLRGQSKDSEEIARLHSKKLEGLWCLPLANNAKKKVLFFIEKGFIDPLLGPENDFAVSYESQQEVAPGQLMPGFNPVLGDYPHGKGLSSEEVRKKLLHFLKHPAILPPLEAPNAVADEG